MVKFANENSGIAGVSQVLTVSSEVSITGKRSSRSRMGADEVLLLLDTVKLVALDKSTAPWNWKTQNAVAFAKGVTMRGTSFQTLVTVSRVLPTEAT